MMKTIHSYWAYLVLVILIATVVNALIGLIKKRKFSDKDLRLGLFTLIFSHIQILIGVGWYFSSPYYNALKTDASNVMGDAARFKTFVIFYGIGLLLILSKIPWNQWPIV